MTDRPHLRLVSSAPDKVQVETCEIKFIRIRDSAGFDEIFIAHGGAVETAANHERALDALSHWAGLVADNIERRQPPLHWPLPFPGSGLK